MSLQRPRVNGSRRCPGRTPTMTLPDNSLRARVSQPDSLKGKCEVCGRWFPVTNAGKIRPHIDYWHERETRSV
jgi:hypothetical protein